MARKQFTQLIDDLDSTPIDEGGETILFSLDGRAYEIDLSDDNAQKLRDAFAPFVSAGRSVSRPKITGRPARERSGQAKLDLADVRAWARENGHSVSDRGRIPAVVLEAYEAAH
ncbi:Lsr2 family protein [Microbacterium sp. 18062]|uniref:histone-like nucleoid-structuring protein Lsr2 n=1 Tax=Microbacterium sp. 18062 TaxID=2681410 RepID=UPI00135B3333|nr:Lsr2 family protein [Microbacterium sp. 18062]